MKTMTKPKRRSAPSTAKTLKAVQAAGEDFEWYPTTDAMIAAVVKSMRKDDGFRGASILDVGAGDGRVLTGLRDAYNASLNERDRVSFGLFSIEKSLVLVQHQPDEIIPVGTDFIEQDLMPLKVSYIFCNPPYSEYEQWAAKIIATGYAYRAYLVIPRRWKESKLIADAIKRRGVSATVIHEDDFSNADRRARAIVDVVEIDFDPPTKGEPDKDGYRRYRSHDNAPDPFEQWFTENVTAFNYDSADDPKYWHRNEKYENELSRLRGLETITDMVNAYNEERAVMEENYRAIFGMDPVLLKELGVTKDAVCTAIKLKFSGLKTKYWQIMFERLDTITRRLATKTREEMLKRLNERVTIDFTANNAYMIAMWAIKNANKYYDRQLIELFRDLSTREGTEFYKSNQKTWVNNNWRYANGEVETNTHYKLDYRIVVHRYGAIKPNADHWGSDYPGDLCKSAHDLIADIIAVFGNLGFGQGHNVRSYQRHWESGATEKFYSADNETLLFDMKAFKNGNIHLRFKPEAIRALNIEAARLLKWIRSVDEAVEEMGYPRDEVQRYYGRNQQYLPSSVKLLGHSATVESQPQPESPKDAVSSLFDV